MNRRIVAIAAAFILALVGGGMVFVYAKNADARALAGQQTTSVFVTTQQVTAGTSLKEAVDQKLLQKTSVAVKGAPTGVLNEVNADNETLIALTDIGPGQYVLSSAFGETELGTKAITVPEGKVAMSIELTDPARVGQFVTRGSRIAIWASQKPEDVGDQWRQTRVIIGDAEVIAMGTQPVKVATPSASASGEAGAAEADPAQTEQSFLVTLALKPSDASLLANGIATYDLYLGLKADKLDIKDQNYVNTDQLFPVGRQEKVSDKANGGDGSNPGGY